MPNPQKEETKDYDICPVCRRNVLINQAGFEIDEADRFDCLRCHERVVPKDKFFLKEVVEIMSK